jgi:CRP/FNR family transcriptional regulator, anaerobic regulatory protein
VSESNMLQTREEKHHVHPVPAQAFAHTLSPGPRARSCASCSVKRACLPCGLDVTDIAAFSRLATVKRKILRGASLFRAGDALQALYAVHSGAFKTVSVSRDGQEKVTGFYFPGEMLGLDAINTRTQGYGANALEDSEVCVLPFEPLQRMAQVVPALQQQLFRALSADISRDQGLMLLLGGMSAEQRLAAFLLSLSRRYRKLGYSPDRFVLRMPREDIGSYIGLTLETVSRLVSRFQREKLIRIRCRDVQIIDMRRLTEVLGVW